ncbi:hypothetical protein HD554DRAFT_2225096 [Boletus coccyginus]|nr:hypothetical protein HD554DRAFT_2225096 [Boletus coccyginus]
MVSTPLQSHRAYAHHTSPSSSPFAREIPFPTSPLPSSPLASPSQSPTPHSQRPLLPSSNGLKQGQGSPTSIHSSRSQFQPRLLCSPHHATQSHFHIAQGSSVQIIPSPSRSPRTRSLIQQSFGNPYAAQVALSPPDDPRNVWVSLGAESLLQPSTRGSPVPTGQSFIQGTPTTVKGDSTPLNEAPIRWWGGRKGWLDDWDNALEKSQGGTCDTFAGNFPGCDELYGAMGMGLVQCGNPLVFREPFGRGRTGPGAFLDEEIHASLDGVEGVGAGSTDSSAPGFVYAPTGVNAGYEMEGIPVSRAVPMTIAPVSTGSRIRNDSPGYCEVDDVGLPPVDGAFIMQNLPDNLMRRHSCHFQGNASGATPGGTMFIQGQELGHGRYGYEHIGGRSRRFSNASTRSSVSYISCMSGPSQSQSQSLLLSSSQSHTNTCPSLCSLGIGIEEAERESRRSRTFWGRRNSGSTPKRQSKDVSHGTRRRNENVGEECQCSHLAQSSERCRSVHADSLQGERVDGLKGGKVAVVSPDVDPKKSATHMHEKDTVKHGSFFARSVSKHGNVSDEQMQRVGYSRAEKYVSLAITSILPTATITMLSPVGEALVKARESARFVGHEFAPVVRDTLSISTDILSLAPLPGLEEAAKALLSVWDACQKVDTNRLSCLRLAERCATLLYSVRCDIDEAGVGTTLDIPVERLCGALAQIQTFLEMQLHRPFLKRYVRREEITRELQACNDAITDAAARFGVSVQIRTYHEVCSATNESKRFAQEAHALLSLDHQIIQRQYAMLYGQQVQTCQEVMAELSGENALGITTDGTANGHLNGPVGEDGNDSDRGGHLTPPPAYGQPEQPAPSMVDPSPTMRTPMPTGFGSGSGRDAQTSFMLSTACPPDVADPTVSVPPTPTPTQAMFALEETKIKTSRTTTTKTGAIATQPASPMLIHALKEVHRAQDSVDAAADEASLRGTLAGALDARSDVEMIRCLQVARAEIPEAAETLRRMLAVQGVGDGDKRMASERREHWMNMPNSELDRKFMQNGIEAMIRLTSVAAKQPQSEGEQGGLGEGIGTVSGPELPSWTITRYEVIRTRKIGTGFLSDVYLGHWRKLTVVIKVLAHSVSRAAFVRHVELWNALDHPNVLPLYGASSAVGEKPWFLVSKFCSGDNLAASLKQARVVGTMVVGDKSTVRVDLLRFMHEIAKGMAYLHGRGVLHGDLRAAKVLVDENGQCVLSDFDQCEIESEAHQSCVQPEPHPIRWRAPEMLMGDDRPTKAADVYAFAMCCVEILGMGDLPWATLDDRAIRELVLDKDERPPIPVLTGNDEVVNAVANLVHSCWVREPDHRPSIASITASLEEVWTLHGHGNPQICRASPSSINIGSALVTSTQSSPADEQYETASESMTTDVEDESVDGMTDVSLTSPAALGSGNVTRSAFHLNASNHTEDVKLSVKVLTQVSGIPEHQENNTPTPTPTPTNTLDSDVDTRNEENYRQIAGLNHAFHSSLTLPLWFPTRVELGAVGYLSKPKGEFITLFNAIDPLQSSEELLRRLPSMYGYGKFEIHKREEGKRSMAQRSLDAISVFLTFKTRGDRSHPERIARQYAFPLAQGKPSAHLCVERTVHRYMDHLEVPTTWFKQHVDLILEVCALHHAIQREDLILVVGTLDAPDWAVFVSDDHFDGRAQFNVFAGREKGEPWGMYSVERAVKSGSAGPGRWVDEGQGTFASKVSCVTVGAHDAMSDTVMLAGLHFEQGMQTPTVM